MKLSIWSTYYKELPIEDAVQRFIDNGVWASELSDEHGFELLERSDDVVATGKQLAAFLKEKHFEMPQGHLWLRIKICEDETAVEKLFRWIDLYEAIGIKNMVLHCDNMLESDLSREEKIARNVEKLRVLADYVKGKDITICLENLRPHSPADDDLVDRSVDDLLHIIERIGSDRFGICLDTGHLNLTDKDQAAFIHAAGSKLKALHIADNEGKTDQHMMPFGRGRVKFDEVVKALREVNYTGLFNLEIPGENRCPLELRDAKIAFIKAGYDYLMKV